MRRRLGSVAAAIALALTLQPAYAQEKPPEHPVFGHTLLYGTGLINTPYAFVPAKTTIFGSIAAVLPEDASGSTSSTGGGMAGIALARFLEVGVTIYDLDAYGLFGKLQILRQQGAFPAMAVGLWNVTAESRGRYGLEDPLYAEVKDAASIFGVFTYVVGPGGTNFPIWLMFSGGWGTGLFLEENPSISDDSRGGIFGSVAMDIMASDEAYFRFMFEFDGFDSNMGASVMLAGLEVMLGVLSVDEGAAPIPLGPGEPLDQTRQGVGFIYNQAKPFIAVSMDIRALGAFPWIWGSDDK